MIGILPRSPLPILCLCLLVLAMMSRANSYVIDTNILNYILDGELWVREPASLMRARPELMVAYKQAGEQFEATDKFYVSLRLSKLAHHWCLSQRPRLFVSPTVHTEMMQAPQVSVLV